MMSGVDYFRKGKGLNLTEQSRLFQTAPEKFNMLKAKAAELDEAERRAAFDKNISVANFNRLELPQQIEKLYDGFTVTRD
jgi:type II restriction/modification system DNA methylase subunit YeeA